jgi:hypothetical protein
MNVTGTWKGEYIFEETKDGGSRLVVGTVVEFTMELKQGWLGMVNGTITEDATVGFAEPGVIKGRLKERVLVFEKLMPKMRMIHEKSRMTLEQIADRYGVVMDTDTKHPKIRHIGDLSEDGKTMEGTWLMQEFSLAIPGSGQSISLPKLAGTWKVTRE